MNILVCTAQVPFTRGGAEMLAEGLTDALKSAGHRAELVALPFQWLPHVELFKSALAWRLLDLSSSNGMRVDRIIVTKFPSYAARHPHKIVWLVHQYPSGVRLVRHHIVGIQNRPCRPTDPRETVCTGPPRTG